MTFLHSQVKHPFGSLAVAAVTPFTEQGHVDYDAYASVVSKLVTDGCDAILVSGTTGEAPTTSDAEKQQLIRVALEASEGRAMVYAGAGSNDSAHVEILARQAQEAGAQGILVCAPYYSRPSQEGVYQHVMKAVEACELPVMIYDIPGRTGVTFTDLTINRLAEHPRVVAVKDATGDPAVAGARAERTGLAYYSGDDGLNLSFLANGAVGVVSVIGHVVAPAIRRLIEAAESGDYATAREIQSSLQGINSAIMGGGQGAVLAKTALVLDGTIPGAYFRLPQVPATPSEIETLRVELAALGIL
ncbi:4-hydroxy-tetrahydrodipicolinate synthase [Actinomycetaceae bacterium TAE3-ERU4]|nr:4-hydroxy-tetrahydrodipicolinate synthase [Actinomycetaceae bacterium TAE3-ERU4]